MTKACTMAKPCFSDIDKPGQDKQPHRVYKQCTFLRLRDSDAAHAHHETWD